LLLAEKQFEMILGMDVS
jgi:hypothetical protein